MSAERLGDAQRPIEEVALRRQQRDVDLFGSEAAKGQQGLERCNSAARDEQVHRGHCGDSVGSCARVRLRFAEQVRREVAP